MFSSPMKPFDRNDLEHWGAQAPNHLVVMAKSDTMAVVGLEVDFDDPPKGKVAGVDPVENVLAKVCFIKYKGQISSSGSGHVRHIVDKDNRPFSHQAAC